MTSKLSKNDYWAGDAIFYHIYPLGLCGAPPENDHSTQPEPRLEAIYEWIGHLEWLGVNAIYLGPLFESGSHGYDTTDYERVDRRLGTNDTLTALVDHAHSRGMRIVLDAVFNHVGRDFFAFRDVVTRGEASPYCSWFSNLRFDVRSPMDDPFTYDTWGGQYELAKLDLTNDAVVEYFKEVVTRWFRDFHIDGLRFDAANVMDFGFLRELAAHCRSVKEDCWLLGEVVEGDYTWWANPDALDSVTNYEAYKGLYSSHNDGNYFEIAHTLKRQFAEGGLYRYLPLYNFADNHDVDRIASTLHNPAHLYPLLILLFTMPGIPSLYYGSEWGIEGRRLPHTDRPVRPRLTPHGAYAASSNRDLVNACRKLIDLRRSLPALAHGEYRELTVSHQQLCFLRETAEEKVIVAVNADTEPVGLHLPVQDDGGWEWRDLLNDRRPASQDEDGLHLSLHPNWGAVLRRER